MSYLVAIIGPISEIFYFKDYWMPESIFPIFLGKFPLMIEDLFFGFAIGGISAVIYEIAFRKKLSRVSVSSKYVVKTAYVALLFVIVLLGLLGYGINSIYASAVAFVASAMIVIFIRHDLFKNALFSGIGVMFVMFLSYLFLYGIFVSNAEELLKQGWLLHGSSLDTRAFGIPVTEMVWGFAWGFFAGPWYEFVNRKKNLPLKS